MSTDTSRSEVPWVGAISTGEDSGIAELRVCDASLDCGTSGIIASSPEWEGDMAYDFNGRCIERSVLAIAYDSLFMV